MVWVIAVLIFSWSAGLAMAQESFQKFAEEFVYGTLALSPISASGAGYHTHEGRNLDELLDDVGAAAQARGRALYAQFGERLKRIDAAKLSPEDRADYDIIADQIALALLDYDKIQSYRHNPTSYVEALGTALFNPLVLEYAPKPKRMGHIIARLEKVPAYLADAKKNLTDSPEIWTTVAQEENQGNIDLVDKEIRAGVDASQRAAYERATKTALAALRDFQEYLKNDLAKRHSADWRLGRDLYRQKFRYSLATDLTPEQVLARAEADVKAVRARMLETARPLFVKMYPGRDEKDPARLIADTLLRISDKRSTPQTYMEDARRDLAEAREFVRQKHLLTLPPRDNLQVIPTPEFMRGIYSVGGFNQAPALEPELGAFYWVTPIPKDWPANRIESKLREYNFYKLKLLTIHEAIPGHYVQLEYANDIQPKTRRVLRALFGNGPYIEGWAQYATQMVLDEGFLNHSPELRLTFQKEELRVLANAILDIRLQTMGMTDQQALDLMQNETFQEAEEANGKLRRAKLSSCQLPTYLVGWRDWIRVRDLYRQTKGAQHGLSDFNDRALKEGAAPLPVLARLLTGKPLSGR